MPGQSLVEIARENIDAFNAGDRERFKKTVTTNAVYEEIASGRRTQGADEWVQMWQQWRRGFPDAKGTITNAVASGNTVVQEVTWEGKQTGPLDLPNGTFPPSGRRMMTRASIVYVFEGDRIKEGRHYFDMLSLLQQIGAMPQQARGTAG